MSARFRDPPAAQLPPAEALEVAAALLELSALPAPLAYAPLWLCGLSRLGDALHLRVGAAADSATHTLVVRRPDANQPAQVEVRGPQAAELGPAFGRLSRALAALPAERWQSAWALAARSRTAAADLPLGYFRQLVPGTGQPTGLVRTGFLCNQDCGFCWQDRRWQGYERQQILTWIEDLAAAGARQLLISGGEPTLDPALAEYVALARARGIAQVGLETNAILLGKPERLGPLLAAGLGHAIVSLHSPDGAVSDRMTRAPGTFAKTVAGLQALLQAGLPIDANAVLSAQSLHTIAQLPDFLAQLAGPRLSQLSLILSMPSQPFVQQAADDLSAVPPETLRAALAATTAAARRLGLRMQGSEGPCGPPLCAFGGDPWVVDRSRRVDPVDFRVFLAPCDGCALRPACLGVRREDVQRWGDAAVAPLLPDLA